MSYTALYRKFRPLKFKDMVGQEHITRTLKNQIISERVGHAYLFNGSRGTGKTSAAKILARAINCLNPQDGEPCNECEICKGILSGAITDVVEMDAASNNSVEDIRTIRDEVNFLPTVAKYRVYIIDEVHMLSTGAFNALLKTLEEPPEHVKFILATTEPQKLPATILSRCQRFDFKRIQPEDIIKRLNKICEESNIEIEEGALALIALLSEGALRDAISILERCMQATQGIVTEDSVRELVGIPKFDYINKLVKNIIDKNTEDAIKVTDKVLTDGKDIDNFLWEVIKQIKDILVYKSSNMLQMYNEEEKRIIQELADKASKEELLKMIYGLSELANDIKWSSQKNIMFQAGIVKVCMEQNIDIQKETIANNVQKIINLPDENAKKTVQKSSLQKPATIQKQKVEVAARNNLDFWNEVLDYLKQNGKMMIYTNLIGSKAKKVNDLLIEIELPGKMTAFGKKVLEDYSNKAEIEKIISMKTGQKIGIKYKEKQENSKEKFIDKDDSIESIAQDFNLPIDIVEE